MLYSFAKMLLIAGFWAMVLPACRQPLGAADADAGANSDDASYPFREPRRDLVPAVGAADTLDVATWNVENFPRSGSTPELLADLITSLELDLVAVQEIADTQALDEVVARLRHFDAVVSSHRYGDQSYQKIAYLFRRDLVSAEGGALLFVQDGYTFPRPPLKLFLQAGGKDYETLDFSAVAVHLKAGVSSEDRERREAAVASLEAWVRSTVEGIGDPDILLLGDFNEELETQEVFAPFAADGDRYRVRTANLDGSVNASFLPSSSLIDHIVTTDQLERQLGGASTLIPALDGLIGGYEDVLSDHLPVVLRIPLTPRAR